MIDYWKVAFALILAYTGVSVGYFTGWLIATVPGWF